MLAAVVRLLGIVIKRVAHPLLVSRCQVFPRHFLLCLPLFHLFHLLNLLFLLDPG